MTHTERPNAGLVEPMTLKGFRDYLPEEMIARNWLVDRIRTVYEKYGFLPIETPVLEYLTTLIGTGGEAINKELFRLESPEHESIAMRFDLTVPFARVIAQYPDKVKLPFRRYHIGPVFRADKPGPGRYRQFTQFDIDAAGSESTVVDAEVVAAMCEVMRSLGLRNEEKPGNCNLDYQFRINNRKLMDAVLEGCGLSLTDGELSKHVLRVIDKLQKVGLQNVRKELGEGRIDDSGDPITGVGLEPSSIDQILGFVLVKEDTRSGVIQSLTKLLPVSERSRVALQEMNEMVVALDTFGVGETEARLDPSLARGLDYYTGPVFEGFLPGASHVGSVMGGGRFDHLVERFMSSKVPATGASIGLDRLVAGLSAIHKLDIRPTTTKVIVLTMKGVPMTELLSVVSELRRANIATELYMGESEASMKDQLSYANGKGIPFAVIIGPDELAVGKVSVKDLAEGKERRTGIGDREQYKKAGKAGQKTVDRKSLCQVMLGVLERTKNDETRS